MLPLFGPSSTRDAPGLAVDFVTSPLYYWDADAEMRWALFGLDVVNTRANLLGAEKFLDTAAMDRYTFLRDTYLQRREYLIRDGNPPTGNTSKQKTLKELEEEDSSDEPLPIREAPRIRKP